jgi:hypothetical protein
LPTARCASSSLSRHRGTGHLLLPLWLAQTWLHLATAAQRDVHERARATGAPPDLRPLADLWGAVAEGMRELAPAAPLLAGYEAAARAQRLHILTRLLPQPVLLADAPELQPAREAATALTACLERLAAQVQQERESPLLLSLNAKDIGPEARRSPLLCDVDPCDPPPEIAISYLGRLAPMVSHSCAAALALYLAAAMEPALAARCVLRDVRCFNQILAGHLAAFLRASGRCYDTLAFAFYWDDAATLEATLPAGGLEALGDRLGEATYLRSCMRTVLLYNCLLAREAQGLPPSTPFELDAELGESQLRACASRIRAKGLDVRDRPISTYPDMASFDFLQMARLLEAAAPPGPVSEALSRVAPGCSAPLRWALTQAVSINYDGENSLDWRKYLPEYDAALSGFDALRRAEASTFLLLHSVRGAEEAEEPLARLGLAGLLLRTGNIPAGGAAFLSWASSEKAAGAQDAWTSVRMLELLFATGAAGMPAALAYIRVIFRRQVFTFISKRNLLNLVAQLDNSGAPPSAGRSRPAVLGRPPSARRPRPAARRRRIN